MRKQKVYYQVCAYIWHEGDERPTLCLIAEYDSREEAIEHLAVAPVNDTYQQWNVYRDAGYDRELIARKDECGINTDDL